MSNTTSLLRDDNALKPGATMAIRVLVIDDDKNYYTLTSRMLARTHQDFEVDWVDDFEISLSLMERREHHVYLVDYHLGKQSGIDLVNEAVRRGVSAPMIMMTGQGEHDVDLAAIKAGASDYIDKTELKPTLLARTIRYAMERHAFLTAINDREDSYKSLLEDASDGIIIMDDEGTLQLVNTRIHDILGYPDGALKNGRIQDLMHKSDKGGDPLTLPEESHLMHRVMRCADGEPINVEVSARALRGDRIQFIVRDITERMEVLRELDQNNEQLKVLRQVDEELSEMLNIEHVLALALDASIRLSGANAGFIGLMDEGRLRIQQSVGHYSDALPGVSPLDSPIVARLIRDRKPRLIRDVTQEFDYVTLNSRTRSLMLIPLMSYERMIGILNLETRFPERFTDDVFQFLRLLAARAAVAIENAQLYSLAQEQLAQLQDLYAQVSALEKIKTDMIRIAAHDLRNPVGVIVGYTQLLEHDLEPVVTDKRTKYLTAIENAAKRMEKITTDILSLERIEKIQLQQTERVNLSELVTEVFKDNEVQANNKSQRYMINLPIKSIIVQGDDAQLREAISNLVGNAIKYTPERGTITVTLARQDGKAIFTVKDTGYGIPDDQQSNLFQPFYRAHTQETSDIEGTGLGLHLVKNIIERLNGRMVFHSVYGEGSTFGFEMEM